MRQRTLSEVTIDVAAERVNDALLELLPDLLGEVLHEPRTIHVQRLLKDRQNVPQRREDVLHQV